MASKYGSVKFGDKEIPLTKDKFPNLVHLPKEARQPVKDYIDKMKKDKKEVLLRELTDMLNQIKR